MTANVLGVPVLERVIEKGGRTAAEIGLDVLENPLGPLAPDVLCAPVRSQGRLAAHVRLGDDPPRARGHG